MQQPNSNLVRLDELVEACAAGQLDGGGHAELEQLVATDLVCRRRYLERMFVIGQLSWLSTRQPTEELTQPAPLLRSRQRSIRHIFVGEWAVGAMVLLAVGFATYGLFALVGSSRHAEQSFIATITRTDGCVWSANTTAGNEALTADTKLTSGRLLNLVQGVAELTFESGARVTLEGPATLTVTAAGECQLQTGQLVALVPRQAIGFRIQAPNAVVVDLGTEFGVATTTDQQTEVVVFQGVVEVQPIADPTGPQVSPRPVRLTMGQAGRVGASKSVVAVDSGVGRRFTRAIGQAPAQLPAPPLVENAIERTTEQSKPWTDNDIGQPKLAGTSALQDGIWTIRAGGRDVFGKSDQFHFTSQEISGNATIVARIDSQTTTGAYAKAGVMIRSDLSPQSAYAFTFSTPQQDKPRQGVNYECRVKPGESTKVVGTVAGISAPIWVKLVRVDNQFTGYYSKDGRNWIQNGDSTEIEMGQSAYIGLAVSANKPDVLSTATFSNVTCE